MITSDGTWTLEPATERVTQYHLNILARWAATQQPHDTNIVSVTLLRVG